jgi:hypothetical protein
MERLDVLAPVSDRASVSAGSGPGVELAWEFRAPCASPSDADDDLAA